MGNLNERMKQIKAKITLNLPLSKRETAMWRLYGENE